MHDITIKNFRCYDEKAMKFRRGINLLIGDNAAGKTSLLRACNLVMNYFFSGYSDENTTWKNAEADDFREIKNTDVQTDDLPISITFHLDEMDCPAIVLTNGTTKELNAKTDLVIERRSKKNSSNLVTGVLPLKEYSSAMLSNSRIMKNGEIIQQKALPVFAYFTTEAVANAYGKSHNGASVGIDFGLKTYMTMSDGTTVESPRFLKTDLPAIQKKGRRLSMCKQHSHHREQHRKDLNLQYERIFIENLRLTGMTKLWGRKISNLVHAEFVNKLEYVAGKYGVTVHKFDRFFPLSKTCTCGYINKELTLCDHHWTCPECGTRHHRDELAASNILRQGVVELESGRNTTCRHKTA